MIHLDHRHLWTHLMTIDIDCILAYLCLQIVEGFCRGNTVLLYSASNLPSLLHTTIGH